MAVNLASGIEASLSGYFKIVDLLIHPPIKIKYTIRYCTANLHIIVFKIHVWSSVFITSSDTVAWFCYFHIIWHGRRPQPRWSKVQLQQSLWGPCPENTTVLDLLIVLGIGIIKSSG